MNILLTTETLYPSQIGGPSNTIYWHAKALENENINVTIIATSRGIEEKHHIETDKWLHFNYGDVIYCKSRLSSFYEVFKSYNKYDLVHLSSLFYFPSLFTAIYSFLRGKRFIWSPRGECSTDALKFSSWKKKPVLRIIKAISKNALFHATSAKEALEIKNLFGDVEIIEIPNYLYFENRLSIPVKHQLLFIGRIHPIKALENLIKGFAISNQLLLHNFTLEIVGGSKGQENYLESLKRLVGELNLNERVQFIDHIDGDAKMKKMAESYCLILPSHTENFGNVVIEALNQGTPVIASKNTPWGLLEEYSAGLHVPNGPEDIAMAINTIIGMNDVDYNKMRNNAYYLCSDKFSIADNIGKWITVYDSTYAKN